MHECLVKKEVHNVVNNVLNHEKQMKCPVYCLGFVDQIFVNVAEAPYNDVVNIKMCFSHGLSK